METVNLKNLVESDKHVNFFFTTENGMTFGSHEVTVEDADTVNILFAGYAGKDIDIFDKWVVLGEGEGFTMKGTFYNEQDYIDFVHGVLNETN